MSGRRIFFYVLLAAFSATVLWWTCHIPYRADELFRIVPENAQFISRHEHLADRWGDVIAHPVFRSLTETIGLDIGEIEEWSVDPEIRQWLDKLLRRDLIVAYVPSMGPLREPAWIVGGWIGGESIRLRWLLKRSRIAGLKKVTRHAGGSYWLFEDEESPVSLSFGIVEGMLVGAFSVDPHAVRHVLDVYDGLSPGHRGGYSPDAPFVALREKGARDRGWLLGPDGAGGEADFWFAVDELSPRSSRGYVRRQFPGSLPTWSIGDLEWPGRLLGGVPFAVLGAHPATLQGLAREWLPESTHRAITVLGAAVAESAVMGALFGGDYAGRWSGLFVPGLILSWRVADDTRALQYIHTAVDMLNAEQQWGLVVSSARERDQILYTVEGTVTGPYALFGPRDRVAFVLIDGWIVLASHARTLTQLLERLDRPESLIEADHGIWRQSLHAEDGSLYLYLDLENAAPVLRLVLSAYSQALLWRDPAGSREQRQQLAVYIDWINRLAALGGAHVWWTQEQDLMEWRFKLGGM